MSSSDSSSSSSDEDDEYDEYDSDKGEAGKEPRKRSASSHRPDIHTANKKHCSSTVPKENDCKKQCPRTPEKPPNKTSLDEHPPRTPTSPKKHPLARDPDECKHHEPSNFRELLANCFTPTFLESKDLNNYPTKCTYPTGKKGASGEEEICGKVFGTEVKVTSSKPAHGCANSYDDTCKCVYALCHTCWLKAVSLEGSESDDNNNGRSGRKKNLRKEPERRMLLQPGEYWDEKTDTITTCPGRAHAAGTTKKKRVMK